MVWGPKERQPTIRNVAEHAHDIVNADMSHPIIVVRGGEIYTGLIRWPVPISKAERVSRRWS